MNSSINTGRSPPPTLIDEFITVAEKKCTGHWILNSGLDCRAIQKSNCYHNDGHEAECRYSNTKYMIIFGLVQALVSQIPDFRHTEWLSIVAALMSFAYSFIGSGLSLAKVIDNGEIKGGIGGWPSPNAGKKIWSVAEALGNIAFAFPFSVIFLEIQVQQFCFNFVLETNSL
nr:probable amino acid permease 7 isoform X1 [Ipomoea batatas]